MTSSRLRRDRIGRMVVVLAEPTVDLDAGHVLGRVIGNALQAGSLGIGWLGKSGRPPTAEERAGARAPYRASEYKPSAFGVLHGPRDVPDEQLADRAAIELARIEQQRDPPDLIGAPLPG